MYGVFSLLVNPFEIVISWNFYVNIERRDVYCLKDYIVDP